MIIVGLVLTAQTCKLCGHQPSAHFMDEWGYIFVIVPWGGNKSIRYEHNLVAEKMLGRPLNEDESVHHKNHKRDDNRPSNLAVMLNDEDHAYIHKHVKRHKSY